MVLVLVRPQQRINPNPNPKANTNNTLLHAKLDNGMWELFDKITKRVDENFR